MNDRTFSDISEPAHHHAVQFYGSDESLFTTVSGFLAEGLVAQQPAILIATAAHRASIVEHLCGRLIDCDAAVKRGDLIVLDAEETLDLFMVEEIPDDELFGVNMSRIIEQVINGRTRTVLRAYGEMVDVLWKDGRTESAIKLEILWNKLALKYNFALLCGYSMGSFYKQAKQLEAVCAQHSYVVKSGTKVVPFERRAKLA